jgi:glucose/mannose-6-phosphate isomerase
MLDDMNVIKQCDPSGALTVASLQCEQTKFEAEVKNNNVEHRPVFNVVIAGMGGSALAASLAKSWLKSELAEPLEIVRTYDLPSYVDKDTLVIVSSYSGNTEETLSCFESAKLKGAQVAIIASGGKLIDYANSNQGTHVLLPNGLQPRMAVIYNLRALVALLVNFGLVSRGRFDEIADKYEWLKNESSKWVSDVPTGENYAKQLALQAVGKTAVFYGGPLSAPVAYKWKISWNENAKNLAFWNEFPEFSHNEFLGWESHPVEKPFVVFDIVSNLEHPQILRRFEITDRLLSGKRPKSTAINLAGDCVIAQLLWGSILADFVSIYVAILNGVDPTPVNLIEKLKQELA